VDFVRAIVRVALVVSIVLIVFSVALSSSPRSVTSLIRNPSLLLRSLLSMNVLLPLFAAAMVSLVALRWAIGIALIALAMSPVPPVLPRKQLALVADREYTMGLFGASLLLAVVLAPLTLKLIGVFSTRTLSLAPLAIAKIMAVTVLVPFLLGMIVRHVRPAFAERASPVADKLQSLRRDLQAEDRERRRSEALWGHGPAAGGESA